jgi:hypothetical protein
MDLKPKSSSKLLKSFNSKTARDTTTTKQLNMSKSSFFNLNTSRNMSKVSKFLGENVFDELMSKEKK